jgi:AraC-like DNA-binding protein
MAVLVEDAAEAVAPTDVESGELVRVGDRSWMSYIHEVGRWLPATFSRMFKACFGLTPGESASPVGQLRRHR